MSTQTQASQKKNPNRIRLRADDRAMAILCYGIVGLFSFLCLVPFWYVLVYSFEPYSLYLTRPELPWPMEITLDAYKKALAYPLIWSGYRNTLFLATVGTMLTMTMMVVTAYPLTKRNLKGRNFILTLWVITMFFGGGMIPTYFLMRNLRILNTLWVMVLPGAVSVYNLMITRTFIAGNISDALYEAAEIDGCSRLRFFFAIVVPLSGVLIAILTLFYGVGHWNSYMNAILYLNQRKRFPLQMVLRELLIENQVSANDVQNNDPELLAYMQQLADTMKYSLIIIASVPVLILYPFLQRYFVKGVMIGSVKG